MLRWIVPVLALLLPPAQALASSPIAEVLCQPTEQLRDRLTGQFGAKRHASGIRGPEEIMEVWTDARGDWTLVITYAGGTSCILAMGEDWFARDPHDPA